MHFTLKNIWLSVLLLNIIIIFFLSFYQFALHSTVNINSIHGWFIRLAILQLIIKKKCYKLIAIINFSKNKKISAKRSVLYMSYYGIQNSQIDYGFWLIFIWKVDCDSIIKAPVSLQEVSRSFVQEPCWTLHIAFGRSFQCISFQEEHSVDRTACKTAAVTNLNAPDPPNPPNSPNPLRISQNGMVTRESVILLNTLYFF